MMNSIQATRSFISADNISFQEKMKNYLKLSDKIYPLEDGQHRIENDGLIQDVKIVGGKKNGEGVVTLPDGRKYYLIFKDNIPQGEARRVDPQGNTMTYTVVNGSRIGDAVEKVGDSQINFSFSQNGLRDGEATEKNSYGIIKFKYVNGVRQYPATIYGNDNKVYHLFYWNGKPNGVAKIYLPHNKIIYCTYNNGYPEGKARMVLPNRNEIIFSYVKGVAQGPATEHFAKGYAKFNLLNGQRVGAVAYYSNLDRELGGGDTADELMKYAKEYGSALADQGVVAEDLYVVRNEPIRTVQIKEEPIGHDAVVISPEPMALEPEPISVEDDGWISSM